MSLRINQTNMLPGFFCPVCQQNVPGFMPIGWEYIARLNDCGYIHPFFQAETFNLVNYYCPRCSASDRDRLYALFLEQFLNKLDKNTKHRFIDFAPAPQLQRYLKKFPFLDYRSADLFAQNVDDHVDIMNMDIYDTESVDFFLCSHVLEHVSDDRKAISELYRILKPGKCGILMVPIILSLQSTYEDTAVVSPEERRKYFGQDDHLRVYAKSDFIGKVKNAGFEIHQFDISVFGAEIFKMHGIHKRSVLYIVTKQAQTSNCCM